MREFEDKKGNSWPVLINTNTIRRLMETLNVDLRTLIDEDSDLLVKLQTDPVLLVNTMYVICKPALDAASVDDEAFGELLDGDSLDRMAQALLDAYADFSPPRTRKILYAILAKMETGAEISERMALEELEKLDVEKVVAGVVKKNKDRQASASGD